MQSLEATQVEHPLCCRFIQTAMACNDELAGKMVGAVFQVGGRFKLTDAIAEWSNSDSPGLTRVRRIELVGICATILGHEVFRDKGLTTAAHVAFLILREIDDFESKPRSDIIEHLEKAISTKSLTEFVDGWLHACSSIPAEDVFDNSSQESYEGG